jgi:hypothetical protein
MPKITLELEIELDKPLRNAEDGRYLCASLEEGISNGWYDFLMNEQSMPAAPTGRGIIARKLRVHQ